MRHLETFNEWLKYQGLDQQPMTEEVAAVFRSEYERIKNAAQVRDVHAVLRAPPQSRQFRYAIAIEDGAELWLTLWIKRSLDGECFVLYPHGKGKSQPHASYHRNGVYHQKHDDVARVVQRRQRLDQFKGTEHLGMFAGHSTGVAICNSAAFNYVLKVPAGILDTRRGGVLVDLVESGHAPAMHHRVSPGLTIVAEQTFRDVEPWVVVAVAVHGG